MTNGKRGAKKGFTLIELLVVIAIIAILSVVVVLTLNPAEMLRRSRDSNRLSDLSVFSSAMNVYTQDRATSGGSIGLGTSSVIYISIPDPAATTSAGSDCSNLGFPAGGTYHCAGPNYFRRTDGTGWIPVNLAGMTIGAPLGQLPTDPTNVSSSGEYYEYTTNGTAWKMAATPESTQYTSQFASFSAGTNQNLLGGFPNSGWVSVPGNSTFGTHNFAVMKYDAVCSDGNGNYINTPADPSYANTYDYATAPGCSYPAALPGGFQIVDINQASSSAACASIGAHLITNNEWQTIAWNAENVASNWQGGVVGTNYIYSGKNDGSTNYPAPADPNDANGYAGTDSVTNQRRTLTLSNGQVVWDMAGNVWQWTNNTIAQAKKPVGGGGTSAWSEWTTVGSYDGTILTQQTAGPLSGGSSGWNSTQGVGQYFEGTVDPAGFIRGGGWGDGGDAGVGALHLLFGPGTVTDNFGFRCAR